jgi:glyoxylase-like metal-dependent hydrolase (beta-lactamase superfamily II)/rhodanese-related sulfurtransferase
VSPSTLISSISTDELLPLLDGDSHLFLLDVREPDEVADWHIRGAHNIPLEQLKGRLGEVPADDRIVLVCAKGLRAQKGAELLAAHDVASSVLEGGMKSWTSTYDQVKGVFGGAYVVQIRRRGKGCLSYVLGAGESCVVIDPSLDLGQYLGVAKANGWTITHVLDTHLHADHISGARALVAETGATLMLSPDDPFTFDFEPLSDGWVIELAPGVRLSVSAVSVPGHTEGSTMYQLGNSAIFTGDTLFLESVGRPDLAEQAEPFAHYLYRSLHERILPLDDEIMVFPAHFGASVEVRNHEFVSRRLGELRKSLGVLELDENAFVAWAIANVKDRPPNYQRIVRINSGQEPVNAEAAEIELGPNRCAIA